MELRQSPSGDGRPQPIVHPVGGARARRAAAADDEIGIGVDVAHFLTHDPAGSPEEAETEWKGFWGVGDPSLHPGGLTERKARPVVREVFLLQRKTTPIGVGLGKTSGWAHRAVLKQSKVTQVSGATYDRIDDDGLHVTVDGVSRVIEVDTAKSGQAPVLLEDLFGVDEIVKADAQESATLEGESLRRRQLSMGYTLEDLEAILHPMVEEGAEAIGSMGDDTPIAVLSRQYRGLHHYFRQAFAQVTNPPIDRLRETRVMSLKTRLGNLGNVLDEDSGQCDLLQLESPVLSTAEFAAMVATMGQAACRVDCCFPVADGDAPALGDAGEDRAGAGSRQLRLRLCLPGGSSQGK